MRPALAALLVLLAGCLGTAPELGAGDGGEASTPAAFEPVPYTFDGTFLVGGFDEVHAFSFEVPNGTTEVAGLLTWTMPAAVLDFQLVDPAGELAADGWAESDQHRFVTTTTPPIPGRWTAVVAAEQGAAVEYVLALEARLGEPFGPIERTYTVPPQDFAEVNLNMMPGDAFTFQWSSDAELYFNVHYHADGETARPIEHRGTSLVGNFTAPETQVYSLLWRNEGLLPVEVSVAIDGTYRLHSMTRDTPGGAALG